MDTSAWIEWFLDSDTARSIEPFLPSKDDWIVPTIVQLELAKWLMREADEERSYHAISFTKECRVVPLDTDLALAAADASARNRLPLADAIIYATAQGHGVDLLTCDAHFEGLPGVTLISKS